jgi:hypothetical protein
MMVAAPLYPVLGDVWVGRRMVPTLMKVGLFILGIPAFLSVFLDPCSFTPE